MKVTEFAIKGPLHIELKAFADDRGFFAERYKKGAFAELGLKAEFVQDNFSRSLPKVLRGLHYQFEKPQGKLVTALRGKILDVAVDIRKGSPTFGKHISVEIDGDKPSWLWVPAGFAHGFCVLGNDIADVMYKVDNYYNAQGEAGILWSDADLKVDWQIKNPILSPKDAILQSFKQYSENPKF